MAKLEFNKIIKEIQSSTSIKYLDNFERISKGSCGITDIDNYFHEILKAIKKQKNKLNEVS